MFCQMCGSENPEVAIRIPFLEQRGSLSLNVPGKETMARGVGSKWNSIYLCEPCSSFLKDDIPKMLKTAKEQREKIGGG